MVGYVKDENAHVICDATNCKKQKNGKCTSWFFSIQIGKFGNCISREPRNGEN